MLFFGRAGCVDCHAVAGQSNEMFSDFRQHVAGIPQVFPSFSNMTYDGPGANEDFGLEQVTGNPADGYLFRTSPLRNVALQPAFMHNGALKSLEEVVHFYNTRDVDSEGWAPPEVDRNVNSELFEGKPLGNFELDAEAEAAIVAFLRTLTDRDVAKKPTGTTKK